MKLAFFAVLVTLSIPQVVAIIPPPSDCYRPNVYAVGLSDAPIAYVVLIGDYVEEFWWGLFLESNGEAGLQQGGSSVIWDSPAYCQLSENPDLLVS